MPQAHKREEIQSCNFAVGCLGLQASRPSCKLHTVGPEIIAPSLQRARLPLLRGSGVHSCAAFGETDERRAQLLVLRAGPRHHAWAHGDFGVFFVNWRMGCASLLMEQQRWWWSRRFARWCSQPELNAVIYCTRARQAKRSSPPLLGEPVF